MESDMSKLTVFVMTADFAMQVATRNHSSPLFSSAASPCIFLFATKLLFSAVQLRRKKVLFPQSLLRAVTSSSKQVPARPPICSPSWFVLSFIVCSVFRTCSCRSEYPFCPLTECWSRRPSGLSWSAMPATSSQEIARRSSVRAAETTHS